MILVTLPSHPTYKITLAMPTKSLQVSKLATIDISFQKWFQIYIRIKIHHPPSQMIEYYYKFWKTRYMIRNLYNDKVCHPFYHKWKKSIISAKRQGICLKVQTKSISKSKLEIIKITFCNWLHTAIIVD